MTFRQQLNLWIAGARPRTLPAAIAPVLVGTAIRFQDLHSARKINWVNALLALTVSLCQQIAVNYANDYSDGIKGTDENRVGPLRLVGSGTFSASAVKRAALFAFGLGSTAGLLLSLRTSLWLILVGALAILAAWFYTGGERPYGYRGFGEVSVFIFFGLVATMGSYFAQAERINSASLFMGISMGLLSCALLAVNNLRDLPKDALVGKKTLAVRLGDSAARKFFQGLLIFGVTAAVIATYPARPTLAPILAAIGLTVALQAIQKVRAGAKGADLIPVLGETGRVQLLVGLLSTIIFVIS